MQRLVVAGVSLALATALGLGSANAADRKVLVFVVNGASDFWKIAEAGVKKAQGELPNYDLQFKYPEQAAAAVQQRVMDDLVAAGAAGIMVSAVDPKNQTEHLNKVASQTVLFTTDSTPVTAAPFEDPNTSCTRQSWHSSIFARFSTRWRTTCSMVGRDAA